MSDNTNKKLDQVLSLMERLANIPGTPPPAPTNAADHDLLLKVDTKLAILQQSVDKIILANSTFITREEQADVIKNIGDHETRLRFQEKNLTIVMTWGAALVVALNILQFVIGKFL